MVVAQSILNVKCGACTMRFCVALLSVVAFLTTSISAIAATFSAVQGDVAVNRGRGFQQALAGSEVQPGDRVMVKRASNARITYENGCTIVLEQPGLYDVPNEPPCEGAMLLPLGAAAVAVGVGIYFATKSSDPSSP